MCGEEFLRLQPSITPNNLRSEGETGIPPGNPGGFSFFYVFIATKTGKTIMAKKISSLCIIILIFSLFIIILHSIYAVPPQPPPMPGGLTEPTEPGLPQEPPALGEESEGALPSEPPAMTGPDGTTVTWDEASSDEEGTSSDTGDLSQPPLADGTRGSGPPGRRRIFYLNESIRHIYSGEQARTNTTTNITRRTYQRQTAANVSQPAGTTLPAQPPQRLSSPTSPSQPTPLTSVLEKTKSNWWLYALIIVGGVIIILGGIAVWYYMTHKAKGPAELPQQQAIEFPPIEFKEEKTSEELAEQQKLNALPVQYKQTLFTFIKNALSRGYDKTLIRQALLSKGWDTDLIDLAIRSLCHAE